MTQTAGQRTHHTNPNDLLPLWQRAQAKSLPADCGFSNSQSINSQFNDTAMLSQTHKRDSHRRGFTMVELLIVIVISGILTALLLPAIGRVRITTNEARVKAEISQIESAIAIFKSTYGVEPPSSVSIYEANADWLADPASMAKIRRIWPQFLFADTNRNGDSDSTDSITLTASECLVFFLGGVLDASGTVPVCTGFSKNPSNPGLTGGTREGPFFEFDASRLTTRSAGGFTVASYLDPLPSQTAPYLYFSSYEGLGYVCTDATGAGLTDVYRVSTTAACSGTAYKPQSYQLISAGYDKAYGSGALFTPNSPSTQNGLANSLDYDNLTNFNPGRLFPR